MVWTRKILALTLLLTLTACDFSKRLIGGQDSMSADQDISRLNGKTFGISVRQSCIITITFEKNNFVRLEACQDESGRVLVQKTTGSFRIAYDRIIETLGADNRCPPAQRISLGSEPPHYQLTGDELEIRFKSGMSAVMTRLTTDPIPAVNREFGCYGISFLPKTFKKLPDAK